MELREFLDCTDAGKRVVSGSEAHRFMRAASFGVMELTNKLSASHDLSEIQELFAQITDRLIGPLPCSLLFTRILERTSWWRIMCLSIPAVTSRTKAESPSEKGASSATTWCWQR